MTCPRPHRKLHEFRLSSPGLSWLFSKNNEGLDFTHSLRKQLLIISFSRSDILIQNRSKFPVGCIGEIQQWAAELLACPHGHPKDQLDHPPLPLQSVQLQLVLMGVRLVWNKKKRSLKRAFVTNKNGILQPSDPLFSPLTPQQKTTHCVHLVPWGCNFYYLFSHFSPQPYRTSTH